MIGRTTEGWSCAACLTNDARISVTECLSVYRQYAKPIAVSWSEEERSWRSCITMDLGKSTDSLKKRNDYDSRKDCLSGPSYKPRQISRYRESENKATLTRTLGPKKITIFWKPSSIFCAIGKPSASPRSVLGKRIHLNGSEVDGGKPISDFMSILRILSGRR